MRRKDKQTSSEYALSILDDCVFVSLSTVNEDGTPYTVPVSVARKRNKLYFHCANEGKKLDNIRANNAVCVTGVSKAAVEPGTFSLNYRSAVVTGKAYKVIDEIEKYEALKLICLKYTPDIMDKFEAEMKKSASAATVIRIEIDEVTGKKDDRA